MHRVTIALGVLSIVLLIATGAVVHYLVQSNKAVSGDLPVKASLPFGFPVSKADEKRETLFDAESVILWDASTEQIRYQQNAFERRSIASLTKLMTAIVALDKGMPWDKPMTINLDEYGPGGNLLLHPGESAAMRDLFNASLVGSANNATRAYVRGLGLSEKEMVQAMNRKAIELGLEQTEFFDVTGLSPNNVSTAYEVARLSEVAFQRYPLIAAASRSTEYIFVAQGSNREHHIRNTNKLISDGAKLFGGSKTGYLDEAQYCLVLAGADAEEGIVAVLLGSPSQERSEADGERLLTMFKQEEG